MKSLVVALMLAVAAAAVVPSDAFARRLGGGGSAGMQRSVPPRTADSLPAKPNTPAAAPATAGAAAAAPAAARRSWLGPIAGIAAGLGLAALFSHLGLGAELAEFVMLALMVVAAFFVIRFLLRRFAAQKTAPRPMQYAGAGAPFGGANGDAQERFGGSGAGGGAVGADAGAAPVRAAAATLPAGFDEAGFERIAKMIFIRLQAANDAGDLNDLRTFTTPEMFAAAKLELQERGGVAQRTDVVRIDAEVLDVADEADRQVVSVRFHGLIREEAGGVAEPFDEIWHLTKPADGSREWAIAGIQQAVH